MKRLKSLIIYGVIILLCIAAFSSVLLKKVSIGSLLNLANTFFVMESERPEHVAEIMEEAVAAPESIAVVGVGLGNDYEAVTAMAVENAGGLSDLVKEGDVVLIKPNICSIAEEGSPIITDYRVVQKVIDMVKEYKPAKIIVAEGSINGNAFDPVALKANKYDRLEGAELFNMNSVGKSDCYKLKPEKSTTGKVLIIPKIYMDADVVINIAKLKTHSQGVVSLSLKNAFGIPSEKVYGGSGFKGGLHALGMDKAIVDLNLIRKPDLAIIEGIVGGEGFGPINNTPVQSNVIFAGRDLVALDTVALTFMGFKVEQVPHVKLAAENDMGISDLEKIKIVGADLDSIKMNFKSEFK